MTDIIKRLQKVSDHAGVLLTDPIRPTAIKAACDEAIQIITDLRGRTEWQPIETAPLTGEFLVYGSYLYPDDTDITEYMAVGRSTNKPEYPIETHDGEALLGVFTHWQPLPAPPAQTESDA